MIYRYFIILIGGISITIVSKICIVPSERCPLSGDTGGIELCEGECEIHFFQNCHRRFFSSNNSGLSSLNNMGK